MVELHVVTSKEDLAALSSRCFFSRADLRISLLLNRLGGDGWPALCYFRCPKHIWEKLVVNVDTILACLNYLVHLNTQSEHKSS